MASVLILGAGGCGYQFTVEGAGPVIGGGRVAEGPPIRLALHALKNNTFQPALEFKYTRYLREALQFSGSTTIVEDDLSADFILDGAIISVSISSPAFSQTQTQEGRVTVKVAVKVRHRKTGKVRWSQSNTKSSEFFVGASSTSSSAESGLQFNRVLEDRALEQAGRGVAEAFADQFEAARDQGKFGVESVKGSSAPGSGGATSPSPTQDAKPILPSTTSIE